MTASTASRCVRFAAMLDGPSLELTTALSATFSKQLEQLERGRDSAADEASYRNLLARILGNHYYDSLRAPFELAPARAGLLAPGWARPGPHPHPGELWRVECPPPVDSAGGIDWLSLKARPAIVLEANTDGFLAIPLTSAVDPKRRRPGRSLRGAAEMGLEGHLYYREHPLLFAPQFARTKLSDATPSAMAGAHHIHDLRRLEVSPISAGRAPLAFGIVDDGLREQFASTRIGAQLCKFEDDITRRLAELPWVRAEVERSMSSTQPDRLADATTVTKMLFEAVKLRDETHAPPQRRSSQRTASPRTYGHGPVLPRRQVAGRPRPVQSSKRHGSDQHSPICGACGVRVDLTGRCRCS
jgi:hypothetical protein